MKKILLLAAFAAIALVGRAQQVADSAMLRELARTNAELARVSRQLNTHAMLVGIGGAVQTVGGLMMVSAFSNPDTEGRARIGAAMFAIGSVAVAASFIPLAGSKPVRLDGRGLVVDLPTGKQGRKP